MGLAKLLASVNVSFIHGCQTHLADQKIQIFMQQHPLPLE